MSPFAWLAPLKKQLFGKKITPFSRRPRISLQLEILEDRWNPAPTVTGISPSIGQAVGGTNIVITGSEFTNATEVNFGADAALFFEVQNDTQIVATSPGGPDGIVRGLFRAIRHLVDGDYREAGVETIAAVAAPALMSYASTASLVLDVVDGAYELAGPAMEEGDIRRFRERDAA